MPTREQSAQPPRATPRLRVNFSWTLAGNVIYAGCQWGMLVVLAKAGSPATVGRFAYALALTAPVFMLTNLQLRGVQATDARRRFPFGRFLGLRLVASGVALAGVAAMTAAAARGAADSAVVMAVALAKASESVSDIFYGRFQRDERMDLIARSMVLRGAAGLLGLTLGVLLGGLVVGSLLYAATWVAITIGHDARLLARFRSREGEPATLRPDFSPGPLLQLTRVALPLGAVMFLISLNTNIPRYFLEHGAGVEALGIFAALTYLVVAGNTVVASLGQSATPRLSKLYAAGNVACFRALTMKLLAIASALGFSGIAIAVYAGRPVLSLLYRPEYASAANELTLIAVAGTLVFATSMLGYALTAAHAFRIQPPLCILETTTTLLASVVLIPRLGLRGAAIALLTAATVRVAATATAFIYTLRRAPEDCLEQAVEVSEV